MEQGFFLVNVEGVEVRVDTAGDMTQGLKKGFSFGKGNGRDEIADDILDKSQAEFIPSEFIGADHGEAGDMGGLKGV